MKALSILLVTLPGGFAARPADPSASLDWNARAAEHLLNRAGLGASPAAIERAVAAGAEAVVDELLGPGEGAAAAFEASVLASEEDRRRLRELPEEERREELSMLRRDDRQQLEAFLEWWFDRLLNAPEVLEERMTLFWHGYFPTSQQDVKRSREIVGQHRLFRRHALGSFRELLHAVARDPAMLEYLDNDVNRKGKPNENFARELLELFTLGEGHYDEDDVKEVARAFTGWTDRDGVFVVLPRQHDDGIKRVLGKRGAFDGDDVLEILLERQDCSRHLARRLLAYFEGVEPARQRVERYARLLRRADWQLRPVLRELFLDRAFYRAEVLGARVASPIDFLVGTARRAGLDPPPKLVALGAAVLGERLCFPPSVEGWKGGKAWITTGSLLLRANLAGVLVGELEPSAVLGGERAFAALGASRGLLRQGWKPRVSFARELRARGLRGDQALVGALCEELLASEPTPELLADAARLLAAEREARGVDEQGFLERLAVAEPCLRRVACYVLGRPEAQLH